MSQVNLDLARRVVADLAAEQGITLITPDTPSAVRSLAYTLVVDVTRLTAEEARSRVSLYVPEEVTAAARLLANIPVVRDLGVYPPSGPLVLVGDEGWSDGAVLLGLGGHEFSHHRRLAAARARSGVIGSILWGTTYLIHPGVRLWEESTCLTCDMTAAVVLLESDPLEAKRQADAALASIYRGDEESLRIGHDATASCAASLAAGELHGDGTTIALVLRRFVKAGGAVQEKWLPLLS